MHKNAQSIINTAYWSGFITSLIAIALWHQGPFPETLVVYLICAIAGAHIAAFIAIIFTGV